MHPLHPIVSVLQIQEAQIEELIIILRLYLNRRQSITKVKALNLLLLGSDKPPATLPNGYEDHQNEKEYGQKQR
ncbi:hypothetical protein F2Q69_00021294 [Brassica cretica]|uniref:Uncharacterized protein n=1 Tax=Brassica cretica TaxID=69181 RepID=A0A8S9Q4U7_BRACR|nr:hypothetical protein F2Q69_00021294 [Brassica cretica]